jgi:hypothetical protein
MSNEALELINRARSQARTDAAWAFLNKNLRMILRLVIVMAAVGVVFIGYSLYKKSAEEKFSTILHQSLISQQIGDVEKARNQLKEIIDSKTAPSGVKSIASIRYAAFLLEEGKKSEAEKIYADVNNCSSCDDYTTDLAGLLLVRLWMMDEAQMQSAELPAHILKIENKTSILKNHVAEQRAMLELYKNNLGEAYKIFEKIAKDEKTSQALKARANNGMKMAVAKGFKVEAADKKEEKKSEKK